MESRPEPVTLQPEPVPAPVTGPAVGTLVWGVVVLAVGLLLGAREVTDIRIDYGLLLPVGLLAVGALLVTGALVTALRGSVAARRAPRALDDR